MKNKYCVSILSLLACVALAGCAGTGDDYENMEYDMPAVEYVEGLNVEDAPHQDSFLNQLAMNYRSFAIYNARTSGYPDIAELFAQKAIGAFSGEAPFPETLDNWNVGDESEKFEVYTSYNDLIDELKNDAPQVQPQLAAEVQAKFDCWISAAASGQNATAQECKKRFKSSLRTLKECSSGQVISPTRVKSENLAPKPVEEKYYPETRRLNAMTGLTRSRDGVVIVNNVNIPENLIQPAPVTPMVINQNIYGGEENTTNTRGDDIVNAKYMSDNNVSETDDDVVFSKYMSENTAVSKKDEVVNAKYLSDNTTLAKKGSDNTSVSKTEEMINAKYLSDNTSVARSDDDVILTTLAKESDDHHVSRDEFIAVMLALREELAAINARIDNAGKASPSEKTVIKVQQIPSEPKQRIMEEIFEVRFDFDKSTIKPEYEDLIRQLVATTQANKNVKVSVVGHTDTAGSSAYNYALGGRRAEAVQKMLIEYGIPASQIIAVSAGEEDLKVQTPNNTPNAENRRVRVVKEVQYTEPAEPTPIVVEEYTEVAE